MVSLGPIATWSTRLLENDCVLPALEKRPNESEHVHTSAYHYTLHADSVLRFASLECNRYFSTELRNQTNSHDFDDENVSLVWKAYTDQSLDEDNLSPGELHLPSNAAQIEETHHKDHAAKLSSICSICSNSYQQSMRTYTSRCTKTPSLVKRNESSKDELIWREDVCMQDWSHSRWASTHNRLAETGRCIKRYYREKFDKSAQRYWDLFYKRHTTNFFKDRHYLGLDFPDLLGALVEPYTLIEFGCGVGNAFFPCISHLPFLRVYAFDLSPRAIDLIHQHPEFDPTRISAFVYDPTKNKFQANSTEIPKLQTLSNYGPLSCLIKDRVMQKKHGADAALMLFMLSAVSPQHHLTCFQQAAISLRPGGKLLFRDYGRFDEAELRFKFGQRLGKHFFVRQDGTCAYFFGVEDLCLLAKQVGLVVKECRFLCRQYTNRGLQQSMGRVFIHAVFERPHIDLQIAYQTSSRPQKCLYESMNNRQTPGKSGMEPNRRFATSNSSWKLFPPNPSDIHPEAEKILIRQTDELLCLHHAQLANSVHVAYSG